MKRKFVLKNKRRFTAFIVVVVALVFVSAFASTAYGYKETKNKTILVKTGDTLWDIAKNNCNNGDIRAYIYEIKLLNNLDTSNIYQGSTLILPVKQ